LPLHEKLLAHLTERATESRFPLTPQRIVHDVRQVMPEDGVVCLDNGIYKIWFARNYRTHVANTLSLDNALATMGAGWGHAPSHGDAPPDGRSRPSACGAQGTSRAPPRERRRVPSSVDPEALSRFRRQRPGTRGYRCASPNRYNSLMRPG
jgi:hypothetical protein